MTTLNERIWARHSHPWSGWLEVASYPLLYVPVWNRSWRQGMAVAVWLIVDIVGFPPPRTNTAWMARAMLGEQQWMKQPPRDSSMLITVVQTAAAVGAFTMAYRRRLWSMLSLASAALLLKMWFLQRMAAAYEKHLGTATNAPSDAPNTR